MLKFNLINNYSHILVLDDNFVYSKENYSSAFRSTKLIKDFLRKYFNFFFNFNIDYINLFFYFNSIDIFIGVSYKNNRLKVFTKKVSSLKKIKNILLLTKSKCFLKTYNITKKLDFIYYNKFKNLKINGFVFKSNSLQFLLSYNLKCTSYAINKYKNLNSFYFKNFNIKFFNIFKNFLIILCYSFSFAFKHIILINVNYLINLFFSIFFKEYNIKKKFSNILINNLIINKKRELNSFKNFKFTNINIYLIYLRLFYNYLYLKNVNLSNANLIYFYNYILNFLFKFILKNKDICLFDFNMFFIFNDFNYLKKIKIISFKPYPFKILNKKVDIKIIKNKMFDFLKYHLCFNFILKKQNNNIILDSCNTNVNISYKVFNNKICFCFFDFSQFLKKNYNFDFMNIFNFKKYIVKAFDKKLIVKKHLFIFNNINIIFKRFYNFKLIKRLKPMFSDFRSKWDVLLLLNNNRKVSVYCKYKFLYFIYYFYIIEKLYILCLYNHYNVFKQIMCYFFNKFKIFNNFFFNFNNIVKVEKKYLINKNMNFIDYTKLQYRFDFYNLYFRNNKKIKGLYFDLNFYKTKYRKLLNVKTLVFNLYYNFKNIYISQTFCIKNNFNLYKYFRKFYFISNRCMFLNVMKVQTLISFKKIKIFKKLEICSNFNFNFNNIFIGYLNDLVRKPNNIINKNLYLLNYIYLNNVKLFENLDLINFYFKKFLYYLNNLFFKYLFYIISSYIFSTYYFINLYLNIDLLNIKKYSKFLNQIFANNNYINFLYFKSNYLKILNMGGFCGLYYLIYKYLNNSNFVSGTVLSNYIYYIFLQKFKTNKLYSVRKSLYIIKNIFDDFLNCDLYYKLIGYSIKIKGRLSRRSQRKGIFKVSNGILSLNNLNGSLFKDVYYLNSVSGVSSLTILINLKNLNYNFNFVT